MCASIFWWGYLKIARWSGVRVALNLHGDGCLECVTSHHWTVCIKMYQNERYQSLYQNVFKISKISKLWIMRDNWEVHKVPSTVFIVSEHLSFLSSLLQLPELHEHPSITFKEIAKEMNCFHRQAVSLVFTGSTLSSSSQNTGLTYSKAKLFRGYCKDSKLRN